MSLEAEVQLITEYNAWVLERKRDASDLTPEKFLEERIRTDAAERLFKAIDYIGEALGKWDDKQDRYETQANENHMHDVERILRGDL